MTAPRFFIEGVHAAGDEVKLSGSDAHKMLGVLRLREGDELELIDSAAQSFDAVITGSDGQNVSVQLQALRSASTPRRGPAITVAQALPKSQKMDFVVEKLTELGVATLLPFQSERSIARVPGDAKTQRWRRLAKTAALQCGRRDIPAVEETLTFAHLMERFANYDTVLVPWEAATPVPLRDTLPALLAPCASRDDGGHVLLVIGPEGGFSHVEADAASAAGAHRISLGTRILRTETAALVLVSAIAYVTASI